MKTCKPVRKTDPGKNSVFWTRRHTKIHPVQKGHNAERPLVAPLQGAGFGGGVTQGVARPAASLTLGFIRLPLRGTM